MLQQRRNGRIAPVRVSHEYRLDVEYEIEGGYSRDDQD